MINIHDLRNGTRARDLAVLDLVDGQVILRELVEGITLHTLQLETPVPLQVSPQLKLLLPPRL